MVILPKWQWQIHGERYGGSNILYYVPHRPSRILFNVLLKAIFHLKFIPRQYLYHVSGVCVGRVLLICDRCCLYFKSYHCAGPCDRWLAFCGRDSQVFHLSWPVGLQSDGPVLHPSLPVNIVNICTTSTFFLSTQPVNSAVLFSSTWMVSKGRRGSKLSVSWGSDSVSCWPEELALTDHRVLCLPTSLSTCAEAANLDSFHFQSSCSLLTSPSLCARDGGGCQEDLLLLVQLDLHVHDIFSSESIISRCTIQLI